MAMSFHDPERRYTYTGRDADRTWIEWTAAHFEPKGCLIADIGCGGGIYSAALSRMGAAEVTGVDFSEAILSGARENCCNLSQISFVQGSAQAAGLASSSFERILERALIHHLDEQQLALAMREAGRLLKEGGRLMVQDRTPEDCFLPGSAEHLRGYLFDRFPRLKEKEARRRHSMDTVIRSMREAGFQEIVPHTLWETRKIYRNFGEYEAELRERSGRSILFELNDLEIEELIAYTADRLGEQANHKLTEKDRWTVWMGKKHCATR